MSKLLFYDTETTGVDYKKNSIIQISGILHIDRVEVERFNFNVRPHPKAIIAKEALKANGHKMEDLQTYPPMGTVFTMLETVLEKHVDRYSKTDRVHLVGFNNRGFDDNFFRMFFSLCGSNFFGSWFWSDSLDVLVLASYVLLNARPTMPSFKLHRVAKTIGLKVDDSRLHDSMYDTELTRDVYYAITDNILPPSLL